MDKLEFLNKRIDDLKQRVNRSFTALKQETEHFGALDYPVRYAAKNYLEDLAELDAYTKVRSEIQANND